MIIKTSKGDVRVTSRMVTLSDGSTAHAAARAIARRLFGRDGGVYTMRLDSWSDDHTSHTWQASIGYPASDGGACVSDLWIYT